MQNRPCLFTFAAFLGLLVARPSLAADKVLHAGIIGCDTSHVIEFTKLINNPKAGPPFSDVEVTVAYPGGSDDIKSSYSRVPGYVKQLGGMGIKILDSPEDVVTQADVIMLESLDGRPHLKQFRAVAKGKPVFVDKPAAGSLADLLTIFRIADETHTPVYSSSSLRFVKSERDIQQAIANKEPSVGELLGCETSSPMEVERHHPDLFWYGIHGVEPLFAIMGTGCESVSRTDSPLSTVVVGKWKDGRIGAFRGIKKGYYYTYSVFGTKRVVQWTDSHPGYELAVAAMCEFFKTGHPPVDRKQTTEIYAFMEAADASKKAGGKPVAIADIIERAEKKADEK